MSAARGKVPTGRSSKRAARPLQRPYPQGGSDAVIRAAKLSICGAAASIYQSRWITIRPAPGFDWPYSECGNHGSSPQRSGRPPINSRDANVSITIEL